MLLKVISLIYCFVLPLAGANAGLLDDFEEKATKKDAKPAPPADNGNSRRRNSGGGHYYGGGFGSGSSYRRNNYSVDNAGNVYQRQCNARYGLRFSGCPWRWVGYVSLYRVAPPVDTGEKWTPTPREKGEWVLPFLRVEMGYQSVENKSEIDALESLVEIGYGPFAFSHQQSYFREELKDDPSTPAIESGNDTLRLSSSHLLFRVSSTKNYEVSVGLGQMRLAGNEVNSGLSIVVPFRVVNDYGLGFSGQLGVGWPTDQSVTNTQASVVYTKDAFSIHAGYRWFEISGSSLNLNGPALKVGFHY